MSAPVRGGRLARGLGGWEQALLATLVLMLAVLFATVPGYWSGLGGFLALADDFLPFGLASLGLAVVILSGGIDLSIGAIASLCAVVMAALWHDLGWPIWLGAAAGLAVSVGLGALNGLIVTRLGTEPLIATLANSFIYASVAVAIAGPNPPSGFPAAFNAIGGGAIGGVLPWQLVWFAALAAAVAILIGATGYGRKIVMIGYNREAARWTGVRNARVLLLAYMISGLAAGIAGIVLAAYDSAVRPDMGAPLLLPAITAVVLGGVSIFGGEGRIAGVVLAVLLLGFLRQGLLIAGISDMISTMATGAILLVAIALRNLAGGPRSRSIARGRLSALVRFRTRLPTAASANPLPATQDVKEKTR